jgi:hypothetical protein
MPCDRRKCRIRTSLTFYEQSDKRVFFDFIRKELTLLSPDRTVSASDKKTTKDNLL